MLRLNQMETEMITFLIPDMSCGHCKARVEKALHAVDGQATLTFDMATRRVSVQANATVDVMQNALKSAGYPATVP